MSLLDTAEQKLGRYAIPGLLKIVAGFHFLIFILLIMTVSGVGGDFNEGFYRALTLDPAKILKGEVWRVFSFMLLPRSISPLWALISCAFLWWAGEGLEEAWGSFKVNCYVFLGIFLTVSFVFAAWFFSGGGNGVTELGDLSKMQSLQFGSATGYFLIEAILLAFCTLYPDKTILFMFVIPMKLKWLGFFLVGTMIFQWLTYPMNNKILITAALLTYVIFFAPSFLRGKKQEADSAKRRAKFDAGKPAEDEAFHTCVVCGLTDLKDPKMDFRVADDGEEYCSEHLSGGIES